MGERFLSIKSAAQMSSLSERNLYKCCQNRKLKHYKVGKRIVINIEDLQEFITRDPVEPRDWDEEAREMNK
jgi:excisionase family DNA binding protein